MIDRRQKNLEFFSYNLFSKDRKGVSGVITMVLLILLVVAVVGIVWVVVTNLIGEEIEQTESCFGIFDKVKLGTGYTCYNSSSGDFQFSINVGDIEIDEVLVSISSEGTTSGFNLVDNELIANLRNYPSDTAIIIFPGKNSGRTYVFNMSGAGFSGSPDSIEIAPIVGRKQCGVTDSLSEFDDCQLLS